MQALTKAHEERLFSRMTSHCANALHPSSHRALHWQWFCPPPSRPRAHKNIALVPTALLLASQKKKKSSKVVYTHNPLKLEAFRRQATDI
jgi:hypothetical protein